MNDLPERIDYIAIDMRPGSLLGYQVQGEQEGRSHWYDLPHEELVRRWNTCPQAEAERDEACAQAEVLRKALQQIVDNQDIGDVLAEAGLFHLYDVAEGALAATEPKQ